jgi:hypothetical protein
MVSAAMEAFAAATNKAQPQSEEELESVLNELPRRELVSLSKTYGVQATLKRESLVAKLLRVLVAQLWPTEVVEKDVNVEETASKGEEAVSTNTTEEMTASAAAAAVTTKKAVEKKKAPGVAAKATAAAVVGKKTVATTIKRGGGALSPGKLKRATPIKASAGVTPKKNMDKIHAKQSAKQMTLQEHEQAKKKRAALLLSGSKSKFSVVKKTRSKTKEIADANGDHEVAKTLSFGAAKTPVKKTPAKPTAAVSATKTKPTYKPHAGPLPAFTGDSLFSPKKVEPRPAPMAVAVMKAARTAAPKKVKVTIPTAVSKATPTKKSPVKKSPKTKAPGKKSPSKKASLDEKENVVADNLAPKTTTLNSTSSNTATKTTVTKPRTSVKSTATSTISHEAKKETRRATFAQNAKAKSTASRQQTRTASSRISKTTTVKATTTST